MILDIKINLLEIRVIWQICYNNVAIQNTPIHAGIQPNYQIKMFTLEARLLHWLFKKII